MPGERARVRQVRGGEQPPVLAAGAGLHPGAGGHPVVPADLPRGRVHSLDKDVAYFRLPGPSKAGV